MKQDFISLERNGFTLGFVQTAGSGWSGAVFIADMKDLVEYSTASHLSLPIAEGTISLWGRPSLRREPPGSDRCIEQSSAEISSQHGYEARNIEKREAEVDKSEDTCPMSE